MNKLFIAFLFFMSLLNVGHAAALPEKINVIIPYATGGVVDRQFRHLQEHFAKSGVNLVPVFKPGAEGLIAMKELSESPKDGTVISLTAGGVVSNAEFKLNKKVAEPLTVTGITIHSFIVNPKSKFNSLEKFEEALKNGDPEFNIGYHAVGNTFFINEYRERLGAKNDVTRVLYKGPAFSSTDVAGGHLHSAIVPLSVSEPLHKQGLVNIIAVKAPLRLKLDKSIVNLNSRWKDWEHPDGFMLVAPTGMSEPIKAALMKNLKEYFESKETIEFYERNYLGTVDFGPREAQKILDKTFKEVSKM